MFSRTSRRSRAQARRAAHTLNQNPAQVANQEVRILIATIEDLIGGLAAATDPELVRLRQQTEGALDRARAVVSQGRVRLGEQADELADQGGAYAREHPWTSLGLAALCMLAIGFWTGRTVTTE
jgi:ElaB/YqjD/DUF883 family membrane-anchored ribosome-binding protein